MSADSLVPYAPTPAEKTRVLGDLYYEIDQMLGATQLASQGVVQNALVESYLVHVRVLLDFFEHGTRSTRRDGSTRYENDDVLSADFGFPPRPINVARIYRERLNKDLVHLAYSRGTRLTKAWVICEVVAPVAARAVRFIDAVGASQLGYSLGPPSPDDWSKLRDKLFHFARSCGVTDDDT